MGMRQSEATVCRGALDESVVPAGWDEIRRAVDKMSLKGRATDGEESLAKTASVSSDCSSCGLDRRPEDDGSHEQQHSPCHVTGRLSNVLDVYRVRPKVLGYGQYGSVRECVHRETGRVYACKSIKKSGTSREDKLSREVEILSEIDHRGIAKMVDCHEDADHVHIITEMYSGGELFDRMRESTTAEGCYSERRASRIIGSLLEAVAYLHDRDIVHRDIKPENILFESRRETSPVRLIDFGLSRRHASGDAPLSGPVGTPYYMSPELLGGSYDRSCDVWSVGVIAFACLCGYPPFNGVTDDEIFDSILSWDVEFPSRQWGTKSEEAKDFIRCLLRRDPRKRFTAREALMHPWIKTRRRASAPARVGSRSSGIRYLTIP